MSQRVKRGVVLVLAAGAALAAGCMPPTRVEFIEKLSMENRKIARSTRAFRTAITPLASNQSADANQVRTAYDAMQKTLKDVKDDMAGQMLPPSSSSAADFLTAYKTYLDAEQAILDGPMKQIVDEVATAGAPADQWNVVKAHLDEVTAQENAAFAKLTAAQKTYADEHNYNPMALNDYIANEKAGN